MNWLLSLLLAVGLLTTATSVPWPKVYKPHQTQHQMLAQAPPSTPTQGDKPYPTGNMEQSERAWSRMAGVALIALPILFVILAILFLRLSTSPSRNPAPQENLPPMPPSNDNEAGPEGKARPI